MLTIFVLPELHGKGIGRKIINTLEQDEFYVRATRIEIPASITATEFYRKFGYDYKNGVKRLDEEHHYRLEKFKEAGDHIPVKITFNYDNFFNFMRKHDAFGICNPWGDYIFMVLR